MGKDKNKKNMSEQQGGRGRGFGQRGGDRGRGGQRGGRGGARGGRFGGRGKEEDEWMPKTKLGRLVKQGKIKSFDEIFRFAIPIKEPQIVDTLVKMRNQQNPSDDEPKGRGNTLLREEVMKVKPVQKQTKAGQRTRFKAWVLIGDERGHIGLGQKAHKEVQGAIKGATQDAKMHFVPIRKGYWGNKIGQPHTIPMKLTGACGSVRCRLIPAPRGTAIVGAPTSKKVLSFAGIQDCYTQSVGATRTKGNFLYALFRALTKSYHFLTPEYWGAPKFDRTPYEQFADELAKKN